MKLSYEDHDTITVLTISGEMTTDQAESFRRSCQERFGAGIRDFVLDLRHMTFIDSAGLEALLWLIDEVSEGGGQLRLVSPDDAICKILEITRLERRFNVHDSIESAAKSLR